MDPGASPHPHPHPTPAPTHTLTLTPPLPLAGPLLTLKPFLLRPNHRPRRHWPEELVLPGRRNVQVSELDALMRQGKCSLDHFR